MIPKIYHFNLKLMNEKIKEAIESLEAEAMKHSLNDHGKGFLAALKWIKGSERLPNVEKEQQPEGKVFEVDEVWNDYYLTEQVGFTDFNQYLKENNYKLIKLQVGEGNKTKEKKK
jgi:hypothetical protein